MRSTNGRLFLRRVIYFNGSGRFHFHVLDHLIDQLVFHRFLGRHEAIAVGVLFDLFQRMTRVLEQNRVQPLASRFLNSLA